MRRDLHPVAWWLWAIGLAAYASQTTNPWILLALVAVSGVVVAARRSDQPWARSYRLYLLLGASILVTRVLFRVVFGSGPGHVVLRLPSVPLPHWVLGFQLLGPVTRESLLSGAYDGLRLAVIVVAVGAGNALANPKRLLRSVPSALYEVGTALVVAVTVLPQLAESVQRVRRAQELRAGDTRRVGRLRRFLVPVLEDALERSLSLAAGMDTRGYGRSGTATRGERRATGALMLAGLVGLCFGVYGLLDQTSSLGGWGTRAAVVAGLGACLAGMWLAGRRVGRTFYRPDPWRTPETVVALSGLAAAVVGWWVRSHELLVAYPDVAGPPHVTVPALAGVLLGLVPALAAPEPKPAALTAART